MPLVMSKRVKFLYSKIRNLVGTAWVHRKWVKQTLTPKEYKRFKKYFGFRKVVVGGVNREVKKIRTKSGKVKKKVTYTSIRRTYAWFWNLHTFIDIWKGKRQLTTKQIEEKAREERRGRQDSSNDKRLGTKRTKQGNKGRRV